MVLAAKLYLWFQATGGSLEVFRHMLRALIPDFGTVKPHSAVGCWAQHVRTHVASSSHCLGLVFTLLLVPLRHVLLALKSLLKVCRDVHALEMLRIQILAVEYTAIGKSRWLL